MNLKIQADLQTALSSLESAGLLVAVMAKPSGMVRTVDPATALAIAEAALAYLDKSKQDRWQADISSKLDEILGKLDYVIDRLIALGVAIKEVPRETISLFVGTKIVAQANSVSTLGAGYTTDTIPAQRKSDIRAFLIGPESLIVSIDTLMSPSYGFAPIDAVVAGVLYALYGFALIDEGDGKKFARRWAEGYLARALDPSIVGSIAYARNQAFAATINTENEFNRLVNVWWVIAEGKESLGRSEEPDLAIPPGGGGGDGPNPRPTRRVFMNFRAQGSLASGASVVESKKDERPYGDKFPPRQNDTFSMLETEKWTFFVNRDFAALVDQHRGRAATAASLQETYQRLLELQSALLKYAGS